jgi:hypothetical protein
MVDRLLECFPCLDRQGMPPLLIITTTMISLRDLSVLSS